MIDMRKKWDAVYEKGQALPVPPDRVLVENMHLLPRTGTALELASGLGGNAVELARRGLDTRAWDVSPVAMDRLADYARAQRLPLECEARDVVEQPPEAGAYDVIVVCHFLDRVIVPHIIAALRPGGLLCYQTFTRTRVTDAGPGNPEFRLADNELLALFSDLTLIAYREEGRVGDLSQGFRDEAMMVACKSKV